MEFCLMMGLGHLKPKILHCLVVSKGLCQVRRLQEVCCGFEGQKNCSAIRIWSDFHYSLYFTEFLWILVFAPSRELQERALGPNPNPNPTTTLGTKEQTSRSHLCQPGKLSTRCIFVTLPRIWTRLITHRWDIKLHFQTKETFHISIAVL